MHDTYILDSKLHISEEGLKHGSRLLTKNNLLLLVRGSMLWNTIPICLNKNDVTNIELAFPPYMSYYVSSTAFRKFIYPYAQGSTRFNLCKADFEKASIKLPTLENQKRIYSILSHIDNKIITERQMLNLYNSQKQYLLRQMFI